MTFYVPPEKAIQSLVQFFGNPAPQPVLNEYTLTPILVLSDPSGIVINPTSVDPVLDPQFELTTPAYKNGVISFRISETARLAYANDVRLLFGIYLDGIGWFDAKSVLINKAAVTNTISYTTDIAIPTVYCPADNKFTFSIGINTEFGSGITLLNIDVLTTVQAFTTIL